jgi:RNA polymerase sigma-70 factor (ECF subfamily)
LINEDDLIKKLKSNKYRDKAFNKLLDLYQERLYWHIRKLVLTHENANDVLQNTFLRIYKSLPKFKKQSSLHTWMYRIAYNESLRFLEQNKKKNHTSLENINNRYLDNLVADVFFDGKDIQIKLQDILSKLPDKQRQIFQMKYFDNLKFHDMALILGIKESTIKSSYYATVRHVKKNMSSIELLTKTGV